MILIIDILWEYILYRKEIHEMNQNDAINFNELKHLIILN